MEFIILGVPKRSSSIRYFLVMVVVTPLIINIAYPVFARSSFLAPFAGAIALLGWGFVAILFFGVIFFSWNR